MRKAYMQDALNYAKFGMVAFILGYAALLWVAVGPILIVGWKPAWTSGILVVWTLGILVSFVPLVLAILTYVKMMRPLKANVVPPKKWTSTLEISGYFFGLIVGGYLLWIANKKIKTAQDQEKTPKL